MPSMHISLGDPKLPISGFVEGGMSVAALDLSAKPGQGEPCPYPEPKLQP